MNRRWPRRSILGALAAFAVAGATVRRSARAAGAFTMRLSLPESTTSSWAAAALQFAGAVERRSNGQLTIEVYPSDQLAMQQATIDGLASGVVDFGMEAPSFLQPLFPNYQVFDVPFLFKNEATAYRIVDGPIGAEFFAELETRGIVGLGWGAAFAKEIDTVSRVVTVPDDMKGLRIRTIGGAVYLAMYQALGAIPVTIDTAEAFAALTQRTIDALDVSIDSLTTEKFYTVCKHVAMSNHVLSVIPLLGSKRKIETLPPALQRIVKEEGRAVAPFWRALNARQTADDIGMLKKNGVIFSEIQHAAFRKALDPLYAVFQTKLGGNLLDRVSKAAQA